MRKALFLICLFISTLAWGDGVQVTTFTTATSGVSVKNIGSGTAFHKLTWTVSGTVSGCTVAIDSSTDGVSWNTADVLAAQTCTANGTAISVSFVANYTRVRTVTFAGTGSVVVNYNLYTNNPGTAVPLTAGTTITLTGTIGYAVCTSTCTVTLPVPVFGSQFCIFNDDNVTTVITLAALGSSARYENTTRTAYGTAGTGTFVSGGAAKDFVCLIGRDATHYFTTTSNGTWTAN